MNPLGATLVRWLVCLLLCLGSAVACALEDAPSAWFQLHTRYQYWLDEAGSLTPIQALEQSAGWPAREPLNLNHGYSLSPLWLRFEVEVQASNALDTYLELGSAFLDSVDLYLVEWQGQTPLILDHRQAGDHSDFSQRLLQSRVPLLAVTFPHSGRYSLLLRLHSGSALLFPLRLHYPAQYYQAETGSQVFYSLMFGMLIVLAYFNLMLLLYVRERTFFYNFLFLTSLALYEAGLSGFGARYLWLGNVWINDHILGISAVCSFVFGGHFALRFLELKKRAPRLHRWGHGLISSYALLLPAAILLEERQIVVLLQGVGGITVLYALVALTHQIRHGNDWARYLLLGWSFTIGGYCVFILAMLDIIPITDGVLYIQAAGLVLGNVMVTTAIAARVRRERREKATALHQALQLSREVAQLHEEKEQLQQNASEQIRQRVEEKTRALNQMLQHLQHSNRQLEQATLSDPLTGLGNRRYLDSVFPDIVKQCVQHRSPLGILVIDADHFKKINDTFGHLAGDDCLRKLATILQKYCRRNLDVLVRFGGEEFVMLLPATDIEGVLKVAESIRHHVEYARFQRAEGCIPVTVSLGVYVGVPPLHATPTNLMHKADEALYQAKHNGRNRVEVYRSRIESIKA